MKARAAGALVVLLLASCRANAACPRGAPWSRLGDSAAHFVEPVPLVLTGLAAVPPVVMAPAGWDHDARVLAQRDLGGRYALEPVSLYAPYVVAGGVLVGFGTAAAAGACEVQRPTAAILQAMVVGFALTGLAKFAIGREWPNAGKDPRAPDRLAHPENARRFRPFRAGFAAFPSGHTLQLFAASAALRAAAPELGWGRFAGYPLGLGVAAGMWLGDRHWVSDIVSGALLGEAIGSSAGASFAAGGDAASERETVFSVLPLAGGGVLATFGGPL